MAKVKVIYTANDIGFLVVTDRKSTRLVQLEEIRSVVPHHHNEGQSVIHVKDADIPVYAEATVEEIINVLTTTK
jgi:hypothetical protein